MSTAKNQAAAAARGYYERLIGQAFTEGAGDEAIDQYLRSQGVKDPESLRRRVEARKTTPSLGAVELTKLGGRDAFRALFGLQSAETERPAPPPRPRYEASMSIADAHAIFRRWLGPHYDLAALDAMLATLAAEQFTGDPVWLLIVGGSGDAKTETVQSAAGAGAIIISTIDSKGALLSATPKKEQTNGASGGLLRLLEPRGVLVIKDVTSILSMSREVRTEVLAALREVHDGKWSRNVGADGGKTLTWTGRIAVAGAVTTVWDEHHAVIASMGDRFVIVRMNSTLNRHEKGQQALRNIGKEAEMRTALAEAVGRVLAGMNQEPVTLTEEENARLLRAANLVTLARTSVMTDVHGDVLDGHMPEAPTRFLKQLSQIVRGACAIGIEREEALNLAIRCARDSMPPLRLAILDYLAEWKQGKLSDVWRGIQKPRKTVQRQLEALHMLGVLTLNEVEGNQTADEQGPSQKSEWFYELADGIDPSALRIAGPDKSVDPLSPSDKEPQRETDDQRAASYFSGPAQRPLLKEAEDVPF